MNPYVASYPYDRITCSAATMLNEALALYDARFVEGFSGLPNSVNGAIVVFHGQNESRKDHIAQRMTKFSNALEWVLWVSLGDEGCEFPYGELRHRNQKLWVQTPKPGKVEADRYLIEGYHPNTREFLRDHDQPQRDLNWFFAGQVTHVRREECVRELMQMPAHSGVLHQTQGFMQGMPSDEFYRLMLRSKLAPCPAGPATPDSFRFAEALECGAIPILDAYSLDGVKGYWQMALGDHPFRIVEDWATLPVVMDEILANYEIEKRLADYWWRKYKLNFKTCWLAHDLADLGSI